MPWVICSLISCILRGTRPAASQFTSILRKGGGRFGQDIHGPLLACLGLGSKEVRASMQKLLALRADALCEGHAGIYRGEKAGKYIESYLNRYI